MTWLTWRQLRGSAATTYAVLLLLAALLAITGPALAHLAATAGNGFLNRAQGDSADSALYDVGWIAVLVAPPLIGAFWGAPLISSELAAGTHKLVWNQTVSRTRWLVTKLVVCGAFAMAATGLLSLAVRLVVESHRQGPGHDSHQRGTRRVLVPADRGGDIRGARGRPDRVRGVRLHARRDARPGAAAPAPRDGAHRRRVHRRPGRDESVGPSGTADTGAPGAADQRFLQHRPAGHDHCQRAGTWCLDHPRTAHRQRGARGGDAILGTDLLWQRARRPKHVSRECTACTRW